MIHEIPFVKLIDMNGNYYVFDVNTNNIVEINEGIYRYLDAIIKNKKVPDLLDSERKIITDMLSVGLLRGNSGIEIEHVMTDYLSTILEKGLPHICLQVTQNCNLRCEYCVYSGSYYNRKHNNKRMSWETAKKALDFLHKHCGESSKEVIVGFYGGEPLLEYELVKKCIEYSKEIFLNKNLSFNLTTNATLLDVEKAKYLLTNNVYITISLDGPQEIHDLHRKLISGEGSFEKVIKNLEAIREAFSGNHIISQIMFNCVLSNDVNLDQVIKFFSKDTRVKDFAYNLANVNEVNKIENVSEQSMKNIADRQYEYFKTFLYGVGRLSQKATMNLAGDYVSLLTDNIHNREIRQNRRPKNHPGGPCIIGQHKLFCDVEGNLYPCERVSETSPVMQIGNIEDGIDINAATRILNIGKISSDECGVCWAFDYCSQCVAFADGVTDFSKEKRLMGCNAVRSNLEDMIRDYIILRRYHCEFERFKDISI